MARIISEKHQLGKFIFMMMNVVPKVIILKTDIKRKLCMTVNEDY